MFGSSLSEGKKTKKKTIKKTKKQNKSLKTEKVGMAGNSIRIVGYRSLTKQKSLH